MLTCLQTQHVADVVAVAKAGKAQSTRRFIGTLKKVSRPGVQYVAALSSWFATRTAVDIDSAQVTYEL